MDGVLSQALTFTLAALDLAHHIFLQMEEEKEDQTNFLNQCWYSI